MVGVWILLAITALLVVLGVLEALAHRRNLARIPLRIHVNGTRGKSSVTRLIAAGLREGGVRTVAKTTGTLARVIMPDATEYPVFRPSRPNVIEQVRIVRAAVAAEAQALVIECMAVQPSLQALSEFELIRATHGVITNVRADHLDVMGPEEEDVARALAGMIPPGGRLYTAERRHAAELKAAADDRQAKFYALSEAIAPAGGFIPPITGPDALSEAIAPAGGFIPPITGSDSLAADAPAVSPEELRGFSYVEHADNVALALAVLRDLGVDRATALRGMQKARPDPGAMIAVEIDFFGRRISFVNGFAANDPESTAHIWGMALQTFPEKKKRIAVFNCREDRADRSRQLGEACPSWPAADHYVAIGTGTTIFARAAERAGLDGSKLVFAEDRSVAEVFELLIELAGRSALIMGMGNIGGQGLELVAYFRNRSILPEPA